MTFKAYVQTYLNRVNPATGMIWRIGDIPGDQHLINTYLKFCQEVNLRYVEKHQKPMQEQDYLDAWQELLDNVAAEEWAKGKR